MSTRIILTVCFPVYNGDKYIKKAIINTINQIKKFKIPSQIFVSNNASTDKTLEICYKLKKKFKRFKIFNRKKKNSLIDNYNFLLRKTKTTFLVFHSHDDIRLKNFYQICINRLEKDKKAILAYSHAKYFDTVTQKIYREEKCKNMGKGEKLYTRFINSIKNLETCAFHGIYRTSFIKKNKIFLQNCLGADHVFLNQLSCLGSFIEIKKKLMLMHESKFKWDDGSIEGKIKEKKKQKFYFPYSKVFFKSLLFALKNQKGFILNIVLIFDCFFIYLTKYLILDIIFHQKNKFLL